MYAYKYINSHILNKNTWLPHKYKMFIYYVWILEAFVFLYYIDQEVGNI